MTEEQWNVCTDLISMLGCLTVRGDSRKGRLFSCACVRRVWEYLPDARSRRAVEVLESHADGVASADQLSLALQATVTVGTNAASALITEEPHIVAFYCQVDGEFHFTETAACCLARCVFGYPCRQHPPISPSVIAYANSLVVKLAQTAYENRLLPLGQLDNERLAVLSDALEEAGCTDAELLAHLREPGVQVRGCFAVDAVLRNV